MLTGLGAYIVLEARQWEYLGPDGPGPGFFPMWYGLAMIALSLAVVATGLRSRAGPGPAVNWREVRWALAAWLGLAASAALLKPLGFLLTFALFTFFLVCVVYGRSAARAAVVAVCAALAFYLVFPMALGVDLPKGPLGF